MKNPTKRTTTAIQLKTSKMILITVKYVGGFIGAMGAGGEKFIGLKNGSIVRILKRKKTQIRCEQDENRTAYERKNKD